MARKARSYKIFYHTWMEGGRVWATTSAESEPILLKDISYLHSLISEAINSGVRPDRDWDDNRNRGQTTPDQAGQPNAIPHRQDCNENWRNRQAPSQFDNAPRQPIDVRLQHEAGRGSFPPLPHRPPRPTSGPRDFPRPPTPHQQQGPQVNRWPCPEGFIP